MVDLVRTIFLYCFGTKLNSLFSVFMGFILLVFLSIWWFQQRDLASFIISGKSGSGQIEKCCLVVYMYTMCVYFFPKMMQTINIHNLNKCYWHLTDFPPCFNKWKFKIFFVKNTNSGVRPRLLSCLQHLPVLQPKRNYLEISLGLNTVIYVTEII